MNRLKIDKALNRIKPIPFIVSCFTLITIIYDFGYDHKPFELEVIQSIYLFAICTGALSIILRYFSRKTLPRTKVIPFDFTFFIFFLLFISLKFNILEEQTLLINLIKLRVWVYLALIFIFIREFSSIRVDLKRTIINPAQLFVVSFLLIIIVGGFLLMLPKATYSHISLIDAMFTSTSAVCVTGLVVVNTGSAFTEIGQLIILMLIQIGGLGIMTFASYFSYFFKGSSTYENQLFISDIINTEKIGDVFSTLKKIIIVTFFIEAVGAMLIFQSIEKSLFSTFYERVLFSIFHAVSGFCNAGFSTLQNGLFEHDYRFNYQLQLIIALLIVLGGLGFPIAFNLIRYIRIHLINILLHIFRKRKRIHLPWIVSINTRIVLITSLALLVLGSVLFLIFEYNNTLAGYSLWGKIVASIFGSVTARTAGFNTVDTSLLSIPIVVIMLLLMWIGASPGSTGGGIKTSTFAIAILNFISLVKGKTRIEIFKREIASASVNRAFAIISLSIIVIFISILSISILDIEKGLLNITFECVSAFSTVGLSRGITADLSIASKIILILTMFIGRVSMLSILMAMFKRDSYTNYRYPTEEILIN